MRVGGCVTSTPAGHAQRGAGVGATVRGSATCLDQDVVPRRPGVLHGPTESAKVVTYAICVKWIVRGPLILRRGRHVKARPEPSRVWLSSIRVCVYKPSLTPTAPRSPRTKEPNTWPSRPGGTAPSVGPSMMCS